MPNDQPSRHLVDYRSMVLCKYEYPDGYWKIDLTVTDNQSKNVMACVPLCSGRGRVDQGVARMIKATLSFGSEYVLEVDSDIDPF